MQHREIAIWLRLAIADVQNELDRRIKAGDDWLELSARLIDDVERTIDDIDDLRLRAELRVIVTLLDKHRGIVADALRGIASYDLWDPLRVLEVDLRSALPRQPVEPLRPTA